MKSGLAEEKFAQQLADAGLHRVNISLDTIDSVKYNQLTNQLEVTLRNEVELATYFKGTYTIRSNEGERFVVGDMEPVFIDGNEFKTLVYDLEGIRGNKLTADLLITYGESKTSLEKIIDTTVDVEIIRIEDNSKINITSIIYDKNKGEFIIEITNSGDVDTYLDIELIDIFIDGEKITISLEDVGHLKLGESHKFRIDADLTDEDIEDNKEVTIEVRYGQRKDSLVKTIKGTYEVKEARGNYIYYILIIVIVILLLLILKKKTCPECKHKNPGNRKKCEKCDAKLPWL